MMAPLSSPLIAPFLQFFFAEHLIVHRRVSPETVASYHDTFRLLRQFQQSSVGMEPSHLTLADMQAPVIRGSSIAANKIAGTPCGPGTFGSQPSARFSATLPSKRRRMPLRSNPCWPFQPSDTHVLWCRF